ncbi:MAG: DUF1641 domain-containing protein [Saprospiraceae bacterium]|nr:DUF1641 domain-containing protein [Saprospiraceae bacterium]MCB9325327.1 DUF1641 domain-containing protein [Lewinellaceae bacterium]
MEIINKKDDQQIQGQIDAINQKLDLLLEGMKLQQQKREETEDLVKDLSIIGNDMFKTAVVELDKAGVELDTEALAGLGFKVLRNIKTFYELFEAIESANDFIKDVGPIIQDVGLTSIGYLHELERKGYFEFMRESGKIVDKVVTTYSKEDINLLADNVITILDTVKNLTQPNMLKAMNNAITIYQHMDMENIPEYSLWKAMKEMRSPELKKGIGFMITFLKSLSKQEVNN